MTVPDNALAARVVLLSGTEETLRRRALTDLIDQATAGDEFDLETLIAGDASVNQWFGSAMTAPFLSPRRTVVVRNLLRAKSPKEALEGVGTGFADLPESAFLILVADEETNEEKDQEKYKALRKQWEKAVRDGLGLVVSFESDPKQIKESLKVELFRINKRMSDTALETLIEMTGGSLSRGLEEIDKLSLFVGDEPEIRDADVKQVVMPSREWNVYRMTDAIVAGQTTEALKQIRILVGSQPRPEETIFSRIFPTLLRQLRMLWQARMCLDHRVAPSAIPETLALQFPAKGIASEPEWRQRRLMTSARTITYDKLRGCFTALSDAEARLKGALPSYSALETLERMTMEMIGVVGRR
ncbi:MAG: DNA polymerase III subunit delta [Fimbriimonadaceae bacterium]|nr:DNA polymerase III subunit delta [Fimbriimonadaceae bacterium]